MRNTSHYGWLELIEGILLVVFAVLAFTQPFDMAGTFSVLFGLMALLVGIGEIVFYIHMERRMGLMPAISLISGILCVMLGCCLTAHPETGVSLFMILFPAWIVIHCISRLSHLCEIDDLLDRRYYLFTLVINIIGIAAGLVMIAFPRISVIAASVMLGVLLLLMGLDHIAFAVFTLKND